jgi:hypothetical protein
LWGRINYPINRLLWKRKSVLLIFPFFPKPTNDATSFSLPGHPDSGRGVSLAHFIIAIISVSSPFSKGQQTQSSSLPAKRSLELQGKNREPFEKLNKLVRLCR